MAELWLDRGQANTQVTIANRTKRTAKRKTPGRTEVLTIEVVKTTNSQAMECIFELAFASFQ